MSRESRAPPTSTSRIPEHPRGDDRGIAVILTHFLPSFPSSICSPAAIHVFCAMTLLHARHDESLTVTRPRPFCCREAGCEKTFTRHSDMVRHVRIHTNERLVSSNTFVIGFVWGGVLSAPGDGTVPSRATGLDATGVLYSLPLSRSIFAYSQ